MAMVDKALVYVDDLTRHEVKVIHRTESQFMQELHSRGLRIWYGDQKRSIWYPIHRILRVEFDHVD